MQIVYAILHTIQNDIWVHILLGKIIVYYSICRFYCHWYCIINICTIVYLETHAYILLKNLIEKNNNCINDTNIFL